MSALYYSSIIFGMLAVVALVAGLDVHDVSRMWRGKASLGAYLLLGVLGLVLLPLGIAEAGRAWKASRRLRPAFMTRAGIAHGHSIPAAWEQLFAESPGALEGRGLLLRVTLVDGRIVGGFFGANSLAGYTAHTRDLFIEERWSFDGDDWFEAPVAESRGLWISEREIRSVEAYAPPAPPTLSRSGARSYTI